MNEATSQLAAVFAAPKRFLVIDDDRDFVELMRRLTAPYHCEFDTAYSYEEAMEAVKDPDRYRFIWLDLKLDGGHNGREVFAEIKRIHRLHPPVVIVSAMFSPLDMEALAKIGVCYFLIKPAFMAPEFFEEIFSFQGIKKVRAT